MSNRIPTAMAAGLAAFTMLLLPAALSPARADGVRTLSCVGNYGSVSCVKSWRRDPRDPHVVKTEQKPDEQDVAASQSRERRWLARCKPQLRQDAYGVSRYAYAAPGCEFGKYE